MSRTVTLAVPSPTVGRRPVRRELSKAGQAPVFQDEELISVSQMTMVTKYRHGKPGGAKLPAGRCNTTLYHDPLGVWICVSFRRRKAEMACNGLAMRSICSRYGQGARWQKSRPPLHHHSFTISPNPPIISKHTIHPSIHRLDKFYIDNKISTYNHRANFCHSRQPACIDLRTNNM